MSIVEKLKANWKIFGAGFALLLVAFGLGRCVGGQAVEEEMEEELEELAEDDEASMYTCPMHPEIREPEMGTCPICHMDLVPADDVGGESGTVAVDDRSRSLARIQNVDVETGPVTDELNVFGRVEVDEEAEVDIAAWTGGRIEQLLVSARGEEVQRGQLLARVYSPELYSAQRSLVNAVESREDAEAAGSERRVQAAQRSIDSARTELRLLGVDERQIDEIEETKQARETVDVFATAGGTIQQRYVQSGDYVSTGDRILSLAPLDTVWGQLEIYERDLPRVTEGTPVRVEVPGLDNREIEGRIEFIAPNVDATRRVTDARVILPNEEGGLKPGMYLNGAIEVGMDDEATVSVPRSAVLWTGHRSLVYVYQDRDDEGEKLETPQYVPQPVKLGPRMGDRYIIEEGLSGGETIAKRGAFRIDAELQLTSGPSMMSTAHAEGAVPLSDDETVEVPPEGRQFEPPIDPEQLPDDHDVWYCDMGTVEWAQAEEGDGECPVCGMRLTHKEAAADDGENGHEHDHDHDHDHDHSHTHDHGGHNHAH